MKKPDDSSLSPGEYAAVRREAGRLLHEAGAIGRFPTPVADVMDAARIRVADEDLLTPGLLESVRTKAGQALKRALTKVLGLFDARDRIVFLDKSVYATKQVFIRLHETAHGFLGWQRDAYAVVEDCGHSLSEDTAELFDRQANVFASEVLFQLDQFTAEAKDLPFGLDAPLKLKRRYGSSVYAAIRRYVSTSDRACAVLVLDPPEALEGAGFRCNVRRFITSEGFRALMGEIEWDEHVTPSDPIGRMIPLGTRRMSGPRRLQLTDLRGERRGCHAEAFTQGHQVFVLLRVDPAPAPLIVTMGVATPRRL